MFKRLFKGSVGLFYLIITLKIFPYLKFSYRFKDFVGELSNVLIISGGPTIDTFDFRLVEFKSYDLILINSYNTWERLNSEKRALIVSSGVKIFYYQAPYHKPLNLATHQIKITNFLKVLPQDALAYVDLIGKPFYKKVNDFKCEVVQFRSIGYLDYFGFRFSNMSGVITLINSLRKISDLKIDLIGCDFSWIRDEDFLIKNGREKTKRFFNDTLYDYRLVRSYLGSSVYLNFITTSELQKY